MGELEELRKLVDKAVDRLSVANDAQRRQSQDLMAKLTDLEEKNEALTRANADLVGMLNKLVQVVDETASLEETYTLFHASENASDVIADWLRRDHDDKPNVDAPEDGALEDGLKIPE